MSRPTLTEVLADATHAQEFQTFLESTFCEENLLFWRITNDYAKIEDESIRKTTALEIWEQYVCANSPNQVNITGSHYRGINEGLESAAVDLFVQANAAVFHLMNFDSFPRFLDTKFLLQKEEESKASIETQPKEPKEPKDTEEKKPKLMNLVLQSLSPRKPEIPTLSKLKRSLKNKSTMNNEETSNNSPRIDLSLEEALLDPARPTELNHLLKLDVESTDKENAMFSSPKQTPTKTRTVKKNIPTTTRVLRSKRQNLETENLRSPKRPRTEAPIEEFQPKSPTKRPRVEEEGDVDDTPRKRVKTDD